MSDPKMTPIRPKLARWMRKRGWRYDTPANGIRSRLVSLMDRRPWWDWGGALTIIAGDDDCGNWSEPEPPTWFYRLGEPKRMRFTGYPRHPLSTIEVITSYAEFCERTDGLNEDQKYEWKAICASQDGDLQLGHQFWGGSFYGLSRWETALLAKYLRAHRTRTLFGLRNWVYTLGLHATVHRKRPFRCHVTPPRGSGGYEHWYCEAPRRHTGPHRFGNYEWSGVKGEHVAHAPEAPR